MPLCHNAYKFFLEHLKDYPLGHLQIGVYDGFYFAGLAKAYPQKMFYAIDPFLEDGYTIHLTGILKGHSLVKQEQEYYANTAGLSNIQLFRQKSVDFVIPPDMKVDSFLIDGSHNYVDVARDIQIMIQLCQGNSHCVVYFDDFASNIRDVKRAIDEFLLRYKKNTVSRFAPFDNSSLILGLDFSK